MVVWQAQSGHFLEALCRVQFLKWTNCYIDNRADGIHLIMQASIDDRKEVLTLGLFELLVYPSIRSEG